MQTKVTFLLVGLLAATACAYTYTPEEQQFLWEAFQLQHNKKYSSAFEAVRRFKIFKDALEFIKQHNADSTQTYTVAMNQFGDLTSAEFKAMLGYQPRKVRRSAPMLSTEKLGDDSSIDWVAQGAVTPVKNQGQCGSCWSFSTTGSIEGATEIASGTLPELSEQQLVDCSSSYGNNGCNGGLMDDAFKYVIANGITSESQYPYEAQQGQCQSSEVQMVASISGYQDVTSESPSQMMAALQIGPVSIAIEADQQGFQYYSGGVFSGTCGTNLDHGVLAVGYGTDYSYGDYWKVKNSWGSSWGEQGYIRLARTSEDGPGMCGLLMQPSYPTGAQYIGNDNTAKKTAVNAIWSSCAKSGDKLSNLNVVVSPNPPVKGKDVSVKASGTLDETVTAGTANLDISVMGIPVVKKSLNICTEFKSVKCPIPAGPMSLDVTELIPASVPSGEYTGQVTIVDQNGAEITCINLDMKL